jgi:hypothetical protein
MTTFGSHLTRIMYSLGDPTEVHWSRTNEVWFWLIEAIREFPILRPKEADVSDAVKEHEIELPSDFKEVVSVQWPITSDMRYHVRRSRLEDDFYNGDYYDIDRDFSTGSGWKLWMGQPVPFAQPARVHYLALHDTAMGELTDLTIPDQYLNILTEYCILRAWTERLSNEIRDPTAHSDVISGINLTIAEHRRTYNDLVKQAVNELTTSRITLKHRVDGKDRIY